ncbi:MAG: ABC transporter permease [Mariniblastus sp.]
MTLDAGNSNDLNVENPIPIERRVPDADAQNGDSQPAESNASSTSVEDEREILPLQTSDKVTVYSAVSEVRDPIRLIKNIFGDFWDGRELAWRLFLRNIRGLYRQTLLGLFWAFLPPIANTAIWIVLRIVTNFDSGDTGVHMAVYTLTGMILWQSFIESFQMPSNALAKNRNMIAKLNFPRESLLLVGMGEVIFDLMIRMLLLIPAFLYFEVPFHATLLVAPFAVLALIVFGAGLGLLVMPFGSLYQDVGRFIGMVLPFWMIMTPVVYAPRTEGPGALLNWLNPASPLLLLSRDLILLGETSFLTNGLIFAGIAVPIAILGLLVYRISIPVLVERMTA